MKLIDYKELIVKRSNDFIADNSVGIVLKTAEEIGKNVYGIHIPRLMMGVKTKDGPIEEEINIDSNKCLNSVNKKIGDDNVISSNFINLTYHTLYNTSMPRLIKGEKVTIGVIDQDIKSMYIKPFCRDQIKNRPSDILEMYVPASGNYDGEDLTDDNKYFVRCDSVNKSIRIHMSDANGETSQYDISIDGANGFLTCTDGKRSITIDTNNDEIVLTNEAQSTISMKKEVIDILCGKFCLNAEDSIDIKSPKMTGEIDDVTLTIKKLEGKIDSMTLEGKKLIEKYMKAEIENKKRNITCPVTSVDGLLTVTGYVCPGGVGFGAPPNQKPLPINPQVKENGMANFGGILGMPLVKGQPLIQLLGIICTQLDAVASSPTTPVPPLSAAALASMSSHLITPNVKG